MLLCLLLWIVGQPTEEAQRWLDQARNRQKAGDYVGMAVAAGRSLSACGAGDARCRGRALNLAASADYFRGGYGEALRGYSEALRLLEAAGDAEQQTFVLNNIGGIHFVQGRYEEALRAYQEAERVVERGGGAKWQAEARATTEANLAALLQRLGRYEEALRHYGALAHSNALPADERAQWLTNLGGLLRRLGDPYKARGQYESALRLYVGAANLDARLGTLRNLGIVEALDLGQLESAAQRFGQVLSEAERAGNAREALQARLYLAETRWRQGRAAEAVELWSAVEEQAAGLAAREERWKALYGLGRAARGRGDAPREEALLEEAVSEIEALRAGLRDAGLRGDYLGDKRDVYDERIEVELARPAVDGAAVVRWIERARERRLQEGGGVEQAAPGTAVSVFWLRGDSGVRLDWNGGGWAVRRLRLPARAEAAFERDLAAWSDPRQVWREASKRWGEALLAGLAPGRRTILPDGFLARMPFEALLVSGVLAAEHYTFSYAPALRFAARARRRTTQPPWRLQAVGVGAAEGGDWVIPGDGGLAALPAAREELKALERALPGRVELSVGREATRDRLLDALARARIVHIATHAVADGEDSRRSRLLLAGGGTGRSYVFLPEFEGREWGGVELAVLAACETESGRVVAGEGAAGFGRALLGSGVESVVTSLWRVDDRASAELMGRFYRGLGQGLPRAEALRVARVELLRGGGTMAHPAHWAGFVLLGEGDAPIDGTVSWPVLLAGAGGLCAAVALVLAARGRQ